MEIHQIVLLQEYVVASTNMNIFIKTILAVLAFFLLSMFFAFVVVVANGIEEPKTHNSLLTDYAKEDIQTQVVQDVGIIEEN